MEEYEYIAKDLLELEQMTKWLYEHDILCAVEGKPDFEFEQTILRVKFKTDKVELYSEFDNLFGGLIDNVNYIIGA